MSLLHFLKSESQTTLIPASYKALSTEEMRARVKAVKDRLGTRLVIPAHHYQKDEVVEFSDIQGDSLQLAQWCADNKTAEFIVFCGVHFMAEAADMLTTPQQKVLLPDLRAGCSLADMANIQQTKIAWERMQETFGDTIIPLTYVNSTAEIKAFVGEKGGATVTSSNAAKMITWALSQKERILFLPDQHLGRNISHDLGIPLDEMAVWNQLTNQFECDGILENARVILWKGSCSVHENFSTENVAQVKRDNPGMQVIVHPECPYETVSAADTSGSTSFIINTIEQSPPGSKWAIGTEMNLVKRLMQDHPDKEIISLNPNLCPCMTMNRIDLPHLLWSLESIETGEYVHEIVVEDTISKHATQALNRMLAHV